MRHRPVHSTRVVRAWRYVRSHKKCGVYDACRDRRGNEDSISSSLPAGRNESRDQSNWASHDHHVFSTFLLINLFALYPLNGYTLNTYSYNSPWKFAVCSTTKYCDARWLCKHLWLLSRINGDFKAATYKAIVGITISWMNYGARGIIVIVKRRMAKVHEKQSERYFERCYQSSALKSLKIILLNVK